MGYWAYYLLSILLAYAVQNPAAAEAMEYDGVLPETLVLLVEE